MLEWCYEVFLHSTAMDWTPAMSRMLSYLLSRFTPLVTLKGKYYYSIFQMKKVNFKEVKTTHPLGCWPCMCHLRGTKQCICLCTDTDRLRRQVWKLYSEETDGWRWERGVAAVCKGLSIVSIMDNQLLLQERNPLSFCTLIFKIRIKSTPPWMENADPGAASKGGWVPKQWLSWELGPIISYETKRMASQLTQGEWSLSPEANS